MEIITPKEFAERMKQIQETEKFKDDCHYAMDNLMIEVLNQFGYSEGTKIFEETPKWYA